MLIKNVIKVLKHQTHLFYFIFYFLVTKQRDLSAHIFFPFEGCNILRQNA